MGTKQMTATMTSVAITVATHGSPKMASPKMASPKMASPKMASPKIASPRQAKWKETGDLRYFLREIGETMGYEKKKIDLIIKEFRDEEYTLIKHLQNPEDTEWHALVKKRCLGEIKKRLESIKLENDLKHLDEDSDESASDVEEQTITKDEPNSTIPEPEDLTHNNNAVNTPEPNKKEDEKEENVNIDDLDEDDRDLIRSLLIKEKPIDQIAKKLGHSVKLIQAFIAADMREKQSTPKKEKK